MTYKELKERWTGKVLDYDGYYGGQCWDLAQYYFVKCLSLPSSILGGVGYVNNMLVEPKISTLLKYFNEVSTDNMKEGDVCIWITQPHIAIYDHTDKENYFFSQNPNPCKVMTVSKSNGKFRAFRLKGEDPVEPTPEPEEPKEREFEVGDIVVPTALYNWQGKALKQYDKEYRILGIDERGAILGALRKGRYVVWAVLPLQNIKLK